MRTLLTFRLGLVSGLTIICSRAGWYRHRHIRCSFPLSVRSATNWPWERAELNVLGTPNRHAPQRFYAIHAKNELIPERVFADHNYIYGYLAKMRYSQLHATRSQTWHHLPVNSLQADFPPLPLITARNLTNTLGAPGVDECSAPHPIDAEVGSRERRPH